MLQNLEIFTLDKVKKLFESRLRKAQKYGYSELSVRSLFKEAREHKSVAHFGDYVILKEAIDFIRSNGFKARRSTISRLIYDLDEFNFVDSKRAIVDELVRRANFKN